MLRIAQDTPDAMLLTTARARAMEFSGLLMLGLGIFGASVLGQILSTWIDPRFSFPGRVYRAVPHLVFLTLYFIGWGAYFSLWKVRWIVQPESSGLVRLRPLSPSKRWDLERVEEVILYRERSLHDPCGCGLIFDSGREIRLRCVTGWEAERFVNRISDLVAARLRERKELPRWYTDAKIFAIASTFLILSWPFYPGLVVASGIAMAILVSTYVRLVRDPDLLRPEPGAILAGCAAGVINFGAFTFVVLNVVVKTIAVVEMFVFLLRP